MLTAQSENSDVLRHGNNKQKEEGGKNVVIFRVITRIVKGFF